LAFAERRADCLPRVFIVGSLSQQGGDRLARTYQIAEHDILLRAEIAEELHLAVIAIDKIRPEKSSAGKPS
jgi:hypothetical protein